jgi:proline racemase
MIAKVFKHFRVSGVDVIVSCRTGTLESIEIESLPSFFKFLIHVKSSIKCLR